MSEIQDLRVVQTSPTTFELQTENGCIALAGFAVETMKEAGVYFWRGDLGIEREAAEEIFRKDLHVQAALLIAANARQLATSN